MQKRQAEKSAKNSFNKFTNQQNYGILYKKLAATLACAFRGLESPCRMGSKWCSNNVSSLDGDIFFRKNLRHICTETEKLILYECFRFFCLTIMCEIISWLKLYIVSLANISWRIYSVFLEWNNIKDREYFKLLKDVSIPHRIA